MPRNAPGLIHIVGFVALTSFATGDLVAQRAGGGHRPAARSHGTASANQRANGGGARATATNGHRNVTANVNHNVNVNVNGGHGYRAHPVARGAVAGATAAAVMGHYYSTLPGGCTTVHRAAIVYHQCGSTWYRTSGHQYVVVTAP